MPEGPQPSSNSGRWTRPLVQRTERTVERIIVAACAGKPAAARLEFSLSRIEALAGDPSELEQVRRFVFVLYALRHHARSGGLTAQQVQRLQAIAGAVLQTQGVQPAQSKLSYLYYELRLISSEAHSRAGDHFGALWELEVGRYLSKRSRIDRHGPTALHAGLRAFRLGMCEAAAADLARAEVLGLTPGELAQAQSTRRRIAILQHRFTGSAPASSDNPDQDRDMEAGVWLRPWQETVYSGEITAMAAAVDPKAVELGPKAALAAGLCLLAGKNVRSAPTQRHMRSLIKRRKAEFRGVGPLFRAVRCLEGCYDQRSPIASRIEALGEVLRQTSLLPDLEHELLVWAAAARWLVRVHAFSAANIALRQYRALGSKVGGETPADCLGIMRDLLDKPWYRLVDEPAPGGEDEPTEAA